MAYLGDSFSGDDDVSSFRSGGAPATRTSSLVHGLRKIKFKQAGKGEGFLMEKVEDAQVDRVDGDNLRNSNAGDGRGDADNDLSVKHGHVLEVGGN